MPATGGEGGRGHSPLVGGSLARSHTVSPQSFTQARVGTGLGRSPWDASYSHTPLATSVKAALYHAAGTFGGLLPAF